MAQSVTIAISNTSARHWMRVGGSAQTGFAGVSNPTYTVPSNKRLVLKGYGVGMIAAATAGRVQVSEATTIDLVRTFVFGAGTILEFSTGSGNFVLSGFLEDDI